MRRIRTTMPALAAVLAIGLSAAPAASANEFQDVFTAYSRTGKVDPCKFSAKDLRAAKRQVPKDIEQYAPDLPAAIDAAIQARASGACRSSGSKGSTAQQGVAAPGTTGGGTTTPAPATSTPAQSTPTPPADPTTSAPANTTPQPPPVADPAPAVNDDAIPAAAVSKDDGGPAPAPLILLAVVGVLMLLGALLFAMTRYLAVDPPWLQRARHSGAEAGWRASAAWAEFTDWLRFGR